MDGEKWRERLTRDRSGNGLFEGEMGIRVTRVTADHHAEGEMTLERKNCNFMGIAHGGALVGLMDTVVGCAACCDGMGTVTADCAVQFLRPTRGPVIRCRAIPEKIGRTLRVLRAEVTDASGSVTAAGTFTFFMFERKWDEEG